MKPMFVICLTGAALAFAAPVKAQTISLESVPPVVAKTVPAAGATDVDPALAEIKVTYSKNMQDGNMSWSMWGEENYPETTGEPKYLQDGRTCVLPVKLQPNKFYALWLNSEKFKNFKDTGGRPAVPYLLTFYTGNATGRTPGSSYGTPKPNGVGGQPGGSSFSDKQPYASSFSATPKPKATAEQVNVEDLALQMLAAIRDNNDATLKSLATDSVKPGWRDALPQFAAEMREHFVKMTGKSFSMHPAESLIEGDYGVVKCTGPEALGGTYLVLSFVKTDDSWHNWSLRNSPASTPLKEHLKQNPSAARAQGK